MPDPHSLPLFATRSRRCSASRGHIHSLILFNLTSSKRKVCGLVPRHVSSCISRLASQLPSLVSASRLVSACISRLASRLESLSLSLVFASGEWTRFLRTHQLVIGLHRVLFIIVALDHWTRVLRTHHSSRDYTESSSLQTTGLGSCEIITPLCNMHRGGRPSA